MTIKMEEIKMSTASLKDFTSTLKKRKSMEQMILLFPCVLQIRISTSTTRPILSFSSSFNHLLKMSNGSTSIPTFSPTNSTSSSASGLNTFSAYTYFALGATWIVLSCMCCFFFFRSDFFRMQRVELLIVAERVGVTRNLLTDESKEEIGEFVYSKEAIEGLQPIRVHENEGKSDSPEDNENKSNEEKEEKVEEEEENGNDCSICLSCFAEGEVCRSLPAPCGHMFHKSCIDQWFETSSRCPLCNRSIYTILEERKDIQRRITALLASSREPSRSNSRRGSRNNLSSSLIRLSSLEDGNSIVLSRHGSSAASLQFNRRGNSDLSLRPPSAALSASSSTVPLHESGL